ncbi:MAG: hypothetical protein GY861_05715 [bacterium]|nr:hypothetical protein [bacterium]
MFSILIVGIIMAILAACAWCGESWIYIKAIKAVPPAKGFFGEISRSLKILACTPKLLPLGIDILCTVWLTGAFGFGGMIGGVIGLTISNVISAFIILVAVKGKE